MMRMRLPQQGQGGLSVSSAISAVASAELLHTGMSSSLRAVAMHLALAEPAKSP